MAVTLFLLYSLLSHNSTLPFEDPYFIPLTGLKEEHVLPIQFELLSNSNHPHAVCKLAAEDLQKHINEQNLWTHNFGFNGSEESPVIGKMFGVLVVKDQHNQIGYLAAFSGKMAGKNLLDKFVPPVFDSLTEDGFLSPGMEELSRMNEVIKALQEKQGEDYKLQLDLLLRARKSYSVSLQNKLYDAYVFLNRAGEEKSLVALFNDASYKNPPSGAGECAGPKLLQYAFQNSLKPLALAEFWWGLSPKSTRWQHGEYYPCCKEKCAPILAHMLSGIND